MHDARHEDGRRAAVRSLFEACRKPVDGVVSRHLNRHVSLFISRLLVDTRITPNTMTFVTFGVSLVASWLALAGSYASFAVAGVLMQLNSILDGCDGELARVRFQGSKLGQWLDTVGDDLSNVVFWAAVGYGARGVPEWGPWLARAGWLAAAANGMSALLNYAVLARVGSGDFYALVDTKPDARPGGLVGLTVTFFSTVLRQDFFLFLVMIVALLGWLAWALPVIALGAVITLGVSVVRTAQFFLARARVQPNSR
ncbi:MAG TPA: CDP-alcohol phosphatidyltransferase family protein [Polyangiaceae bacterium]|nr:CDP-alcohol phosphatidyltransferase family protein [Polyangiaceae bacterium]